MILLVMSWELQWTQCNKGQHSHIVKLIHQNPKEHFSFWIGPRWPTARVRSFLKLFTLFQLFATGFFKKNYVQLIYRGLVC
jgi:hypothetical protein